MNNNILNGISNLGNTCYLNWCIQMLSSFNELNENCSNIDLKQLINYVNGWIKNIETSKHILNILKYYELHNIQDDP